MHNLVNTLTLQPIQDYDVTLGDYVTHDAYYAYAPNKDNTAMYFVHDNTVWVMEYDEENSQFSEPRGIDKLPFFAEDTMCGFYWRGSYLSRRTTGCTSATRATKRQEPTSMARLNNIPL